MLTAHHYQILFALKRFGCIDLHTLARMTRASVSATAVKLLGLTRREMIYQDGNGFNLTEGGDDEIYNALEHEGLSDDAKKWINLTRCGIDSNGHETTVRSAAIPARVVPMMYYTPDLEGMIDLLDRELRDYD